MNAEALMAPIRNWKWPFSARASGFLALTLLIHSFLWIGLRRMDPKVFREHGPMENFQVAALLVGCLALAISAKGTALRERQLLFSGVALLYFTIFVLEFDTRYFDLPAFNRIFNGPVRDAWLGMLWLIGFVLFFRRAESVWDAFGRWVASLPGCLLLLSGVFWVAGMLIDKLKLFGSGKSSSNLMAEELMECNAALLMIAAALLVWRSERKLQR